MSLGQKVTLTGTVKLLTANKGSKSECQAFYLDVEGSAPLAIRLKGGNPFYDPALEPFLNKRVSVEGVRGSGMPMIVVDSVADIVAINPPANKARPKGPSL